MDIVYDKGGIDRSRSPLSDLCGMGMFIEPSYEVWSRHLLRTSATSLFYGHAGSGGGSGHSQSPPRPRDTISHRHYVMILILPRGRNWRGDGLSMVLRFPQVRRRCLLLRSLSSPVLEVTLSANLP